MKKIILTVISLFTLILYCQIDIDTKLPPATEELVKSFNTYLETNNRTSVRVGVLEFEDNNEKTSELGIFLCNEITTWLSLYAGSKFSVVSRQDIDKIILEKESSTKYRTNKDKIEVLKKYKLIDYIITATITQFTESYRLNIRILETSEEKAGTVAAVKVINLNRTTDLDKMFIPNTQASISTDKQPSLTPATTTVTNSSTSNAITYTDKPIPNCIEKNYKGHYCFTNNQDKKVVVTLCNGTDYSYCSAGAYLIIEPGKTDCFYNLIAYPGSNSGYMFVYDADEFLKYKEEMFPKWQNLKPIKLQSIYVENCMQKYVNISK